MNWFTMQRRHWRQGETWLLFISVTLAVFACYSLTSMGVLMQQSLMRTSAELMGADRILSATRKAEPDWLAQAQSQGVSYSEQWLFNSMIFADDSDDAEMQLASVKAVDSNYPAKGELLVETQDGTFMKRPKAGEIFVDKRFEELLGLTLEQPLKLGVASFNIAGWIVREPDSGLSIFGNLPSIIMQLDDVETTEIIQPGSRLRYRYLLTASDQQLNAYDEWIKPQLTEIYRYEGVGDEGFALSDALKRSDTFLRLAGLLTMLLTLAAMAVISARFADMQRREVALFKALGQSRNVLVKRYAALMFTIVGLAGGVGLVFGHLALVGLATQLTQMMPNLEITLVPSAILLSLASVGGGCAMFAWRPFRFMLETPAASLIQGLQGQLPKPSMLWRVSQVAFVFALLAGFAQSLLLAALLLASGVIAIALVAIASQTTIRVLEKVGEKRSLGYRLAVRNLSRRVSQNRLLLSGFTLASLMVMSIFYARSDLIDQWRNQLPEGAANHFAMNIQQHQQHPFLQWLDAHQVNSSYMYPVIRGRLSAIAGEPVGQVVSKDDEMARRSIQRELSLTYRNDLPEGNEVIEGEFLTGSGQVSVESKLAERLNIKVGDMLDFDIAGQLASAKVSSLREVDWNSMRPNFYMIFSDDVLASFNASYLGSFYLSDTQKGIANQLIREFPTVTLISVDSVVQRLESVIKQSTMAMTVILVLVTAAAGLLLIAQIRAGLDARQRELITMQTLGASRQLLVKVTLLEFALLGLVAGLVAVIVTELLLGGLFMWVFKLSAQPHLMLWLIGPAFASSIITLTGWRQCRRMLREGALSRLRQSISGG
ncbi:ABC transporter permease [Echinimonas agarilytica]|uniref:ABC3 transporter permease C-terminal domain-containing protein n=1 Tax=Echinimonas agarilytica TaxID=1215918 RepID=A0AA42B6Z4_9GAMM|nr:FtsX-like permease family protein [Echinimonas agarilytica]MCM2679327.1 hypothetical protein [Echinimonas agarilytica]